MINSTDMPVGTIRMARDIWGKTGKSVDRHSYIWAECIMCGKCRWVSLTQYKKGKGHKCKHCSDRINIRIAIKHVKPRPFRANICGKGSGYLLERIPNDSPYAQMANEFGYVLQHRLIMAQHLGRCLKSNEIVHHLNGLRHDNRIDNLLLVNDHNHPRNTYIRALQSRIRKLEQLRLL